MKKKIIEGGEIRVISDQVGSPTSTRGLAFLIWQIIIKNKNNHSLPDILHWSDLGQISWCEFAITIGQLATEIGLISNSAKVIPMKSSEYLSNCIRPKYSVLDCRETELTLAIKQRDWKINLNEVLSQLKEGSKMSF